MVVRASTIDSLKACKSIWTPTSVLGENFTVRECDINSKKRPCNVHGNSLSSLGMHGSALRFPLRSLEETMKRIRRRETFSPAVVQLVLVMRGIRHGGRAAAEMAVPPLASRDFASTTRDVNCAPQEFLLCTLLQDGWAGKQSIYTWLHQRLVP